MYSIAGPIGCLMVFIETQVDNDYVMKCMLI